MEIDFEQRIAGHGAEVPEIAASKALDGDPVEEDLADRPEVDPGDLAERALGQGVEGADALEDLAEQIEPERLLGPGREDIENAAADRIFAGLDHGAAAPIAVTGKAFEQPLAIEPLARLGGEKPGADRLGRRHPLDQRVDRGDHQPRAPGAAAEQAGERIEPPRHDVCVRRDPVIGQAVPGRDRQDLEIGREETGELGKEARPWAVPRDVQQMPDVGPGGMPRQEQRIQALDRRGHEPAGCVGGRFVGPER